MEVKIKSKEGLLDATIEMIDGVMVVSPKKEKFVPKDGDVIVSGGDVRYVAIFKAMKNEYSFYYYALLVLREETKLLLNNWAGFMDTRPATEEEKNLLFDKLAEKGFAWDADKKELIKLKWKPDVGQHFYYPEYDNGVCVFIIKAYTYAFKDQIERDKAIAKGWCFKTSKECQEFCDRLNQAIENIKL